MAVTTDAEPRVRSYGNWRRPTSAGLLGLGSVGTGLLLGGLILIVMIVMAGRTVVAIGVAGVLGIALLVVVTRDAHGKSVLARLAGRIAWWNARGRGLNLYRSGPLGRTLWGTYQLPGLAAGTRLSEHTDSYGRRFAMVYSPSTSTYAVVLGTEPDGASLVDQEQIDSWVAHWGQWLTSLGSEPSLAGASVTIETAPDSGRRLRREVMSNLDENAPEFAKQMLRETVEHYPAGSSTVQAFLAITFNAATRSGGRRREADEMGRELAARLPALSEGLQSAGGGAAHPLDAQRLCETIRVAWDPASAALIDDAHAEGEIPQMAWSDVGPSATEASWGALRHDSAVSCTWAMTQAPRGSVRSSVLEGLLEPHHRVARKRVTLLYRPLDPGRAAAIVEADRNSADFRLTATAKPSARDSVSARAATATANEEAAGAGLVNFGLLVTAPVLDAEDMADATAAIDNLGASARLRLRPVYGAQDSAFTMALPLGLVPTLHVQIPSELREKL